MMPNGHRLLSPEAQDAFSERLAHKRHVSGHSQKTASAGSHMHPSEWSLLECSRREPRLATLIRCAGTIGTSVAELCGPIVWEPARIEGDIVIPGFFRVEETGR